jgi:putative DNA methylase
MTAAKLVVYPKRLIEVDLPIRRISVHARREKSIRHGHISTLHIWWARRPLAACRAVICAALWPDPADDNCPPAFITVAKLAMAEWSRSNLKLCSAESMQHFVLASKDPSRLEDPEILRALLLDFIADFANWDNSTVREYLDTARRLTQAAHESLGGAPGTRPLVVDPFAGGGSIPLEALRVGADVFASDLNPVPVLLNKVVLEYIPKFGQRLAEAVRKWGEAIKGEGEKELAEFYPKEASGLTPVAYLWARTIRCEGPGCGAEVPVLTQPLLAQRKTANIILTCIPDREKRTIAVDVQQRAKSDEIPQGTVKRSSVTCPVCGYTTPAANVRQQFVSRKGGVQDARLLAVVMISAGREKSYRAPTDADRALVERAKLRVSKAGIRNLPAIPDEPLPYLRSIFNIHLLGVTEWGQLFTPRQALLLATFARIVSERVQSSHNDPLDAAALTCVGLALDKMADFHTSLARWIYQGEKIGNTFGRQALGIIWDYAEANPFGNISGSWDRCVAYVLEVIQHNGCLENAGTIQQASATQHPLPNDSASAFITDPPYYDAVPYADLSDFFYVWLKRSIGNLHEALFLELTTPKRNEIVQLAERNKLYAFKTRENFEKQMAGALSEGRRVTVPSGVGVIVFAHKATKAWETMLQAVIDAGWTVVASWPIDTERQGRLRAMDSAALASSVHLVCRPRESHDGSARTDEIGDWRDVLQELPRRIHEWMPRLAEEGVVGADAIFACLGPALEVFSRYSHVERASGEVVTLKEYLEHVWAAVSKEALSMIFAGASTEGFEPDARLTAMWLWTLAAPAGGGDDSEDGAEPDEEDDESGPKKAKGGGYVLEFDAARKIAQGLGATLEALGNLIELSGDKARLLPVSERTRYLFGKEQADAPAANRKKKLQFDMFAELTQGDDPEAAWGEKAVSKPGQTTLDRIHQSMILFAAGRGEALKRFLVEDGAGRDQRFWRLAQALSALYPPTTDEKRWVDGVLARKKGLGL